MVESVDLTKRKGKVRTDLWCHECSKNFIAEINYDLDGNHLIICPYCGHQHCRVVRGGVVTQDRWDSRVEPHQSYRVEGPKTWKSDLIPAMTSSASAFMRDRWLNRFDSGTESD